MADGIKYCRQCGKQLNIDAEFCRYCGYRIEAVQEVKAAVSGIYILEVKGLHGKTTAAEKVEKKGLRKWVDKLQEKAGAKPIK